MASIPTSSVWSSLGGALGTGIAQPIHQGLDMLAQQKMMQMQHAQLQKQQHAERQRYAQGLSPLLGEDTAQFLSNLNPEERKYALQNIGSLMQLQGGQAEPPQGGTPQGGMQSLQQGMRPQMQSNIPQGGAPQGNNKNAENVLHAIAQMIGKSPQEALRDIQKDPELQRIFAEGLQMQPQAKAIQPQPITAPQDEVSQQTPGAVVEPAGKAKILQDIFTSPQEKRAREELRIKQEKLSEQKLARNDKNKLSRFKETSEFRGKTTDSAEEGKKNLFRIKQALALGETGKLDSQAFLTFLKAAGVKDVEGLLSGETVATNKVLADFIKGAKEVYGGRITNMEMDQFLKTIPNLYMSPEGRKRIFAMMRYFNKGSVEKQKTMREIIKENNGIPPYDLKEQTFDRSKGKLKQLSKKFKEELERSLTLVEKQQGSSPLKVGLAHVGGSLLKNLPKAGAGALAGAALGKSFGIPGAVGGAALGGLYGLSGMGIKEMIP